MRVVVFTPFLSRPKQPKVSTSGSRHGSTWSKMAWSSTVASPMVMTSGVAKVTMLETIAPTTHMPRTLAHSVSRPIVPESCIESMKLTPPL